MNDQRGMKEQEIRKVEFPRLSLILEGKQQSPGQPLRGPEDADVPGPEVQRQEGASPIPALSTSPRLELVPVTLREANAFVKQYHRHSRPMRGCIACVAVAWPISNAPPTLTIVGVAIIGRPISRRLQDGYTAEVNRCCVMPVQEMGNGKHPQTPPDAGYRNACSKLYRAGWRAVRALGYRRLVTYTLATEYGSSLRGAGFAEIARVAAGSWNCRTRPRVDLMPRQEKIRWEISV